MGCHPLLQAAARARLAARLQPQLLSLSLATLLLLLP